MNYALGLALWLAISAVSFATAWVAVCLIAPTSRRVNRRRRFWRARALMRKAVGYAIWAVLRAYAYTRPMRSARSPDGRTKIWDRWFLTSRPTGTSTGTPGWYLHHLTAGDYDPAEHNHPWTEARTLVLRGWYFETRSGSFYRRGALDGSRFSEQTFHRIISVRRNTWTLFYAGPKHGRGWGFADGRKARDPNGKQAGS